MFVIGAFRNFFEGFTGLYDFLNTSHRLDLGSFGSITFTPMACFGVGMASILGFIFVAHLIHLANIIFG